MKEIEFDSRGCLQIVNSCLNYLQSVTKDDDKNGDCFALWPIVGLCSIIITTIVIFIIIIIIYTHFIVLSLDPFVRSFVIVSGELVRAFQRH